MRGCADDTKYAGDDPSGASAAARISACIGSVYALKPIASSTSSRASARSSGSKFEMKVPGVAMSASACWS